MLTGCSCKPTCSKYIDTYRQSVLSSLHLQADPISGTRATWAEDEVEPWVFLRSIPGAGSRFELVPDEQAGAE